MWREKIKPLTTEEKKELAGFLNVSPRAIDHWASGRNEPKRCRDPELSEYFGLRPAYDAAENQSPRGGREKKLQEENHKLLKELNQQLKEIINLKDQIENLKEEIQVLKQEDLPPPMLSMGICTPGEKRKTNAK